MKPTDFLVIHSGEPGREGEPTTGYSVRMGWIEGVPYITDLGSAKPVLVNSTPIEPYAPCIIEVGDTITIGETHLTWKPGVTADRPTPEPVGVPAQRAVTAEPAPEPAPAEALPTYRLLVGTADETREFPLEGNMIRIGRSRDNELRIIDARVSRNHAILLQHEDGYEIVDLESAYGLFLDDERISRKVLADGDVIWVSDSTSLRFQATRPLVEPAPGGPEAAGLPEGWSTAATVDIPVEQPAPAEVAEEQPTAPPTAPKPSDILPAEETVIHVREPDQAPLAEKPMGTVVVPKKAGKKPDATLIVEKKPARELEERVPSPAEAPARVEPDAGQRTAFIDMPVLLAAEADLDLASVSVGRDTSTPHLVVHTGDRTWEVGFTKDSLTIGREDDSDITLRDDYVSRHHALIERKGDRFVIREVQSRNGVWLGQRRIDQHTLRNGDVLSIGRAKLVFKGGFTPEQLTMTDMPIIDGRPARHPVVVVPGMMGSELWLGSEMLWPNLPLVASRPEVLSLPGDPRIEARKILDEVVVVPHILRLRKYSALGDYLESGLGYTRGKDLLEFAYDWRQDVRFAAQRLAEAIDKWQPGSPVTIVGHSLGTLVTRYYVEFFAGKGSVERILLMGGPHLGAPKGLAAILVGPGILPFGMGAARMREVLASFPSAYQILPTYPCIVGQNGTYIDALKDESWLPEHQRPLLRAGRSFRREIGERSSVPCVSIFGYGQKTISQINIRRKPNGQWNEVSFVEDTDGDVSVPSASAVLKETEIHPVMQEHGFLFVDDGVKMRLKMELTKSSD